ncbi:MAG: inositol monophosphatase family protein, partial [Myxococcota bacterium]|nr:inositol monophosphatase family protein [Myxococcota bacterium]
MTLALAGIAARVVETASQLAAYGQKTLTGGSTTKADRSPVTKVDLAVQIVVAHLLRTLSPTIAVLGEEDAEPLKGPGGLALKADVMALVQRVDPQLSENQAMGYLEESTAATSSEQSWILDPIDGTKGFLRGDQYAIALAFCDRGIVTAGALGCPNLRFGKAEQAGMVLVASHGHGAWSQRI